MVTKKSDLKSMKRLISGRRLLPLLGFVLLSGCAPLVLLGVGAGAGVAGSQYYDGTMTVLYKAPYMDTWDATLVALKGMGYSIRSADHDLTSGKIVASGQENEAVRISIEYRSAKETEVGIRVGLLGDESASASIKRKITKELFNA